MKTLAELYRILKSKGKVILKLNPYHDPNVLAKDDEYEEIEKDFYRERSGLYLWNLSDELLNKVLGQKFGIYYHDGIYFEKFGVTNRIYYLIKD